MWVTKQPNIDRASLEREVEKRTLELDQSRFKVIWRLAKASEFRDDETGHHVVRIGCYCRSLDERLGMSRTFVERSRGCRAVSRLDASIRSG